jgi:hypothetical protein
MRGSSIRVVLADRIDCRSRQAARGPSRPLAKSRRITRVGLAPSRESAGGVKECRKPDRRWPNREIGGGLPPNQRNRESDPLGSTCRGKALWVGKAVLIDEGAAEAILVPRERRPVKHRAASRGATGSVRGSFASSAHGRQRQARVATPLAGGARGRPAERPRRHRERTAEAGDAPSSACPAGVGLPQGGPASHGRTEPSRAREASCDQYGASRAPGSRTVHGCSCRESVAEVGERHLLRVTEGSREANQGGTE